MSGGRVRVESSDSVIASLELLVGAVPFILQGAVTFPALGEKKKKNL